MRLTSWTPWGRCPLDSDSKVIPSLLCDCFNLCTNLSVFNDPAAHVTVVPNSCLTSVMRCSSSSELDTGIVRNHRPLGQPRTIAHTVLPRGSRATGFFGYRYPVDPRSTVHSSWLALVRSPQSIASASSNHIQRLGGHDHSPFRWPIV